MSATYQQIISCRQLHDLLYSHSALFLTKPSSDVIILDASIPPVGKMNSPEKKWPDCALYSAQRFDLNKNFSDLSNSLPHTMPSVEQFQHQSQALGISDNSQIVVYDDQGIFSAARAWYMFKSMGHNNVAVLNGGLPAWLADDYPVSSSKEPELESTRSFIANFSPEYFCDYQEVNKQLFSTEQIVVDARAAARFEGTAAEPREGMRSGHMPNALNLPFNDLLANGELLPKQLLQTQFQQINNQMKPMIMTCGSGVTACVLALAAEICGYKQVKVYDGSWSEWGADPQLPIVTGK